jgi:hypothetical protein
VLSAYKKMLAYQFGGTLFLAGGTVIGLLACYSGKRITASFVAHYSGGNAGRLVQRADAALPSGPGKPRSHYADGAGAGRRLSRDVFVRAAVDRRDCGSRVVSDFVAGLMSGSLFPTISCVDGKTCTDVTELMRFYVPAGPQDVGKALVWAFIVGFSERLVPDLLQGLVTKEQSSDNK